MIVSRYAHDFKHEKIQLHYTTLIKVSVYYYRGNIYVTSVILPVL